MIVELLAIGGLYAVLKGDKSPDPTPPTSDGTEGRESPPMTPPQALPPEGDDYRVENVGKGDQNNIYLLEGRTGVLYDDGSGGYVWESRGYIRGDYPTGFVSGSAGGITFEIGEIRYDNVVQYATKEDAIEADKKAEEKPDSPQKPQEPQEPAPVQPVQPQPDFGLGGGYTPFGGGF